MARHSSWDGREELGLPGPGSDGPAEDGFVIALLETVFARSLNVMGADGKIGHLAHWPGNDRSIPNHRAPGVVSEFDQGREQRIKASRTDDHGIADVHPGRLGRDCGLWKGQKSLPEVGCPPAAAAPVPARPSGRRRQRRRDKLRVEWSGQPARQRQPERRPRSVFSRRDRRRIGRSARWDSRAVVTIPGPFDEIGHSPRPAGFWDLWHCRTPRSDPTMTMEKGAEGGDDVVAVG